MWNLLSVPIKENRPSLTILVFIFLISFMPGTALSSESPSIMIHLRDGTVIKSGPKPYGVPETSSLSSPIAGNMRLKTVNTGMIDAFMNNRKIQTGWNEIISDVVEIELMSAGLSPYKNGMLRLKKKNGDNVELRNATLLKYAGHDLPVKEFIIYIYDGFNKIWREENLDISKVSRIVFPDNIIVHPSLSLPAQQAKTAPTRQNDEKGHAGIKKTEKISKAVVMFEPGIDEIKPEYHKQLKSMAAALKSSSDKKRKIYITGHTDFDKDKKRSIETSRVRAEAVKEYLVKNAGVSASKIKMEYMGDKKPAATNKTPEGRTKNRRVEVVLK
jgi:outer membrane protein OmpA-like peptidoglycan-associated protein